MSATKIEWADITINPVVGCSKCSPACDNCYAERQAALLVHMPQTAAKYAGVVDAAGKWTGKTSALDLSCFYKLPQKSKRVFVGSMTDLFHAPDQRNLMHIFIRMNRIRQHTFMVLTKRPEAMRDFILNTGDFVPPNVWLGVTVCNQQEANEKIPVLLQTPAAKRFVSIEPMLGAVDLGQYLHKDCEGHGPVIDWVICGGETGPKARPMHPDWVRGLRDQCSAAGIPFFFKGWGEWHPWSEKLSCGNINLLSFRKNVARYVELSDAIMSRVGKHSAGRLLNGVEYSEVPA